MSDAWKKIFEDFSLYITSNYRKNACVRILSSKDEDVLLQEVYVSSSFQCDNDVFSDLDLEYMIKNGQNIIISGSGGAGKTFFMKKVWMSVFNDTKALIPIFIDLRSLNELSKPNITTLIRNTISSNGLLTEDIFFYFCEKGRFVFILDGFDETYENIRDQIQNEIFIFSRNFPKCSIAVSSRPDKRFASWNNFTVLRPLPFSYDQITDLIDKVPFDPESKKKFLKQLDESFYKQHIAFLSNPLLAIMMMMTYKENMGIPNNVSIFYEQAYNTLYQWHDATKYYSREKHLDIEQFRRSFGVFCLLSYCARKFEFKYSEMYEYISKSNKFNNINIDPEKIIKDYTESVNLMQLDGLYYIFIHRSFQEYFTAFALVKYLHDKADEIIERVYMRTSDNVLQIAFEIDSEIITKSFIKPGFELFSPLIPKKFNAKEPYALFENTERSFTLRNFDPLDENNEDELFQDSIMTTESNLPLFISAINTIRYGAEDNIEHSANFMHRMIPTIFKAMSDVKKSVKLKNIKYEIFVKMQKDDFLIEVGRLDLGNEQKSKVHRIMKNSIRRQIDNFKKPLHEEIALLIKSYNENLSWCQLQISKSAERKRSIEDILEI